MAMVVLKGRNGGSVVVNTSNLLFVDGMNTEQGPLLGYSAIVLQGCTQTLCVKGTPDEIYGILRKAERNSDIEIAQ